ncbi:MAG: hypothetical protein H6709_09555 [Kofleriaceae bacterium]|nr:hypothetical protein [Kofleriaceae bacterium]
MRPQTRATPERGSATTALGACVVAIAACGHPSTSPGVGPDGGADATRAIDAAAPDAPGVVDCDEVAAFAPVFADAVATWTAQDDRGGWPDAPVVFVGSSSIRRWEDLSATYRDDSPLQRGFGGAQLGEVAYYADELVVRHGPRAVVVYAGTNDLAAGVAPATVVTRFRCLRERVGAGVGWDVPLIFIGITPTPARWEQWDAAVEVNAAIAAQAAGDPALSYVDVPAAFLATGSPPSASLFVADGLHLSRSGYDLWNSVLRPVVDAATAPTVPAVAPSPLPAGARVLLDLGPSNPEDGEPSPSPDYRGQTWNDWDPRDGDSEVLPGEHLTDLVTSTGLATSIDVVVTGGFGVHGFASGGLRWPDPARLGDLAVGSATGDFFYATADDRTGGLYLAQLDPAARYTLRLFGARDHDQRRVTRYTVRGATTATATLQTSGPGAGQAGATVNDDDVAIFPAVQPDPWGHVFVDIEVAEGDYAYLSLIELTAE